MIKNKFLIILTAALFLNFNSNSISLAIEDTKIPNKYPDYSVEFTGKDSWENFNRKIFIFNSKLNKYVIRPLNIAWASVMPKYGMDRVQNFYANSTFPVRLAGCLLQKDFKSAKSETVRFLTNSTLGVGGIYDPAQTKFKIEPRNEDIEQVLAHYHVKKGPYLVLPIVAQGNVRDIVGKALDCPLNPCSYFVVGHVAAIAAGVSMLNSTTYMQPIAKRIDYTYADPYEITKQLIGVERYIKNSNLDRKDVFAEKIASQNIVKINAVAENSVLNTAINSELNPDIKLYNFNPQSSVVDSMRTALFDNQKIDAPSIWSELSVWNKSFDKQIKTSCVNVDPKRANYKYRYILQKNKTAPLAIIYPSFGEGIMADKSTVQAKFLYDEGYSVVIQGSAFQWEFIKSMPVGYKPGLPAQDASNLKLVTSKIIDNLQTKYGSQFSKKILVGNSFGALTALFVANQEENDLALGKKTLGITNYIAISPPVELFFAMRQVDKYSQDWKNNPTSIKLRTAITAQKIIQVAQNISDSKTQSEPDSLPFTDEEAKLTIGFIMKQKLSDVVFTLENGSKCKRSMHGDCKLYDSINKMSFEDYAQKYLQAPAEDANKESFISNNNKQSEPFYYGASLYSLTDFLQKSKKYKIYHSLDDYFVNSDQLAWLKRQSNDKLVFFSNGSHLGFMYRKEFVDEFKKDIRPQDAIKPEEIQHDRT